MKGIGNTKAQLTDEVRSLRQKIAELEARVTVGKQAEGKLKESEEGYRKLIETSPDAIFVHIDQKMVFMNPAGLEQIGAHNSSEVIGKSIFDFTHPDYLEVIKRRQELLKKGEAPRHEYFKALRLDGSVIDVEATSARVTYQGKSAVMSTIRDITERKKMEEQLIVTDRLASVGELASGIAHELNNPLTSVIGFSALLLGKEDLPDDVKEDLKTINREAQRTSRVVRNLLTFARKHESEKQPVDINGAIKTVLALREYEQKVHNIQVNTQFASGLPEIVADSFQLQQVFLNIIINAEHFMTEAHGRGTLTITTEQVGDIIRASFADDGPGIPKENLGHLFDPFFTTKEVGKGTGLGLSISHGIIAEHGGRIYAEGKVGEGATFIMELPITQ